MKKLMVATIILLPLLILAVMLVSGALMSLVAHIYVESVEFVDNETLVLVLDDELDPPSAKCEVNILPLKASNRDIEFKSGDESIVTIDPKGVVTAKYFGKTYVTVASKENDAAVAMREVLVTDKKVHDVKIDDFDKDIYNGESGKLSAKVFPFEAEHPEIKWSSESSLITVSEGGDYVCHGVGEAQIVATSVENENIKDVVTVRCHEALTGISIPAGTESSVIVGRTAQFPSVIPMPSNATYTVTYSSQNEDIATVDSTTGVITFKKQGRVYITATAVDGRAHSHSVSAAYDCTDGYYIGALFNEQRYTFDYDARKGQTLPEVALKREPDGTYREVVEVDCHGKEGVVEFDKQNNVFRLRDDVPDTTPLGEISVTVIAKKYSSKTHDLIQTMTDTITIDIERKTTSISFCFGGEEISSTGVRDMSLALETIGAVGESSDGAFLGVLALPANHTDPLIVTVTDGGAFASIEGDSPMSGLLLNFAEEGKVTLTATADDGKGNRVTKAVDVGYIARKDEVKDVLSVTSSTDEASVTLSINDNGTKESVELNITEPDGMRATYVSNDPDVVDFKDNGRILEPKKGGFATVTVTFEPTGEPSGAAREAAKQCVVKIYVDEAVTTSDIDIAFGSDIGGKQDYTSKESGTYTVRLDLADEGAMQGKRLMINGEIMAPSEDDPLTYTGDFAFDNVDFTLTASVVYGEEVSSYPGYEAKAGKQAIGNCRATRTLVTTRGQLMSSAQVDVTKKSGDEEAVLRYGADGKLGETGNDLTFGNLKKSITFTVKVATPMPADFELSQETLNERVTFTQSNNFDYTVQFEDKSTATVTVTVISATEEENTTLTVAGPVHFGVKLAVRSLADAVKLTFGEKQLVDGGEYNTFLGTFNLYVSISRSDGEPITSKAAAFDYGNAHGDVAMSGDNGVFTLAGVNGEKTLTVSSGTGSVTITIKKLALGDIDFASWHIEYNDGGTKVLDSVAFDDETHDIYFPKAIQGTFTFVLDIPEDEDRIGGFDQLDVGDYFSVSGNDKISMSGVIVATNRIAATVQLPGDENKYMLEEPLSFRSGDKTVKLLLNCTDVVNVRFTGFNSNVESDVCKGYQQVRVFAKHSYYNGATVDYLRIPVKALSQENDKGGVPADINAITWTLSQYRYDSLEKLLVRQRGAKVIYDGKTYVIERVDGQPSRLKEEGTDVIIAQGGVYMPGQPRVPWVDVYSATDSADIYFGDFVGLDVSDVQNDYFGKFYDAETNWKPVNQADDDGSGRIYAPSQGAYSFLRVEAGDGAKDSAASAHFNFNVLQRDSVVNVFDADGYYANNEMVLHTNLYGPDEGQSESGQQNAALVLDRGGYEIGRDLIFGNGYQINLEARNRALPLNDKQTENTGTATYFGEFYNVIVKGANPTELIIPTKIKMFFVIRGVYYSDVSYYSKLDSNGRILHLKNSILRNIAVQAVQLYYGDSLYIENVVINNAFKGISSENDKNNAAYFKGFVDVLNYSSAQTFAEKFAEFKDTILSMKSYTYPWMEWFGKQKDFKDPDKGALNGYLNPIIVGGGVDVKIGIWDDEQKAYVSNGKMANGEEIAQALKLKAFSLGLYGYTYATKNTVDGGTSEKAATDSRDMSKLFTEDRYIRLLCEYKTSENGELVKNTDHILWHMQKVYRNVGLIQNRIENHVEALKNSLKRENQPGQKQIVWPDGTNPDDWMDTPEAAFYDMLSSAIPTSRREEAA